MKYKLIIIAMLLAFGVQAQHSLVMTRPLEFNGGLAGNAGYDRLSFNTHSFGYNNVTPSSPLSFQGYNSSASYDWLSTKLKGGIGISISNIYYNSDRVYERGGERIAVLDFGKYLYNEKYFVNENFTNKSSLIGVTYSPKFIVNQKIAFSPYINTSINFSDYSYQSVRIDNNEIVENTYPTLTPNGKSIGINTNIGFLLNKESWFAGYKTKLIYIKNEDGFKKIDLMHIAQYGRLFKLKKDSKVGIGFLVSTLIPYLNNDYIIQNYSNESIFSLYLKISNLTLGVNSGGFYGSSYYANYKIKNWSVGYSINPGKKEYGGNKHEIGFQYIFKKEKEKDKLFSVPLRN